MQMPKIKMIVNNGKKKKKILYQPLKKTFRESN